MKRAGIIFCVLAVLAVGRMTAANIAVGAVAEDVRFESELRAGSPEAAGRVRILAEGVGTTVNLFFWAALENVSEASTCMLQSFAPSEPRMAAGRTPMARKRGFSPSEAALEAGRDEFPRGAAAPPARKKKARRPRRAPGRPRAPAPGRTARAPKGGSNSRARFRGDRGPLSREFPRNSGPGGYAPKIKKRQKKSGEKKKSSCPCGQMPKMAR